LEQYNLNAAVEWAETLERKVTLLLSFPYLGQAFKSGRFHGRCTVVGGYRVFYRVTEVEIEIVRVLHEKRDIARLL
jgi:plasmid stabilization system protein ParE